MFVIVLTYEAPLRDIDRLMPEHMAFLERCYAAGMRSLLQVATSTVR